MVNKDEEKITEEIFGAGCFIYMYTVKIQRNNKLFEGEKFIEAI